MIKMQPRKQSPIADEIPLDMVGGTAFGRYPKISLEQTWNMLISDGWMVPSAGYRYLCAPGKNSTTPPDKTSFGRSVFNSHRSNQLIMVIDNGVYTCRPLQSDKVENSLQKIGTLDTSVGNVSIDENNANEVAICDSTAIYIYNYRLSTFVKLTLDFVPTYVTFQDGYFIATDRDRSAWRLSESNKGTSWPTGAAYQGGFQTKGDIPLAAVRLPGKGGSLLIFGSIVTELWTDTPTSNLFPYVRNSYFNIDFGCVNAATVASNNDRVAWVGINEKSGPRILVSDGGVPVVLSNDGINFKLAQLSNPYNSFGFFFEQDGHSIYQCTFPDDDFTIAFDFYSNKFINLSDYKQNYHEARKIAFFNNSYYFVSNKNNGLYELNSRYYTYSNKVIPRVRICKPIAGPDRHRFIINSATFPIEMGINPGMTGDITNVMAADLAVSKDGGNFFGSYVRRELNAPGYYQNRCYHRDLGMANEFTFQYRFYGLGRFVFSDGVVSTYV